LFDGSNKFSHESSKTQMSPPTATATDRLNQRIIRNTIRNVAKKAEKPQQKKMVAI